jgi:outer membrane cobalamin receptor
MKSPVYRFLLTTLLLGAAAVSAEEFVASGPGKRYLGPEFLKRYAAEYDPYGLASLLATQPGVALQGAGDPGGEDWVTFRGNPRDSSRMTLILLDGVPLNGAANGTLEFNTIPVSLLHDITIYYGTLPVRYGGYTSVVELRSKSAADRTEIVGYAGTHDTAGAGVTTSRRGDDWGFTFDLRAHETDGLEGQEYEHRVVDQSDPFNPEVIATTQAYGSRDYWQVVPTLTGEMTFNDSVTLGLLGHALFTSKDYADGNSQLEPDRPANREREFYNLGLSLSPAAGSGQDFALDVFYKLEDHEQLALDDEFVNYGEQRKQQFGVRGHYGFTLTEALTLTLGGDYNDFEGKLKNDTAWDPVTGQIIHYDKSNDFDSPYFGQQDSLYNMAAYADMDYAFKDVAQLNLGVRYDDVEDTHSETSWQLAGQYKILEDLRFLVSLGKTHRYPVLNEFNNALRDPTILGPPLPGIVDPEDVAAQNGKLEMEKQTGGEIGLAWTGLDGALLAEVIVFDYELEGEIFVDVRQVPNNLDPDSPLYDILGPQINVLLRNNRPTKDDSTGVEIALDYNTDNIGLYLNGTWNKLERHYSDGRESHNQPFMPPEYYANAGGYYRIGKSKIDLEFEYRGETDDSLQERGALPDVKIGSSFLTHLGYRYQVTGKLELFARAYNLFDEHYETFYGLPMVERHITGGFRYNF